jgi:hypothetical protein
MPIYKVRKPFEHNRVLYLPEDSTLFVGIADGRKVPSGGGGDAILDRTGYVEVPEFVAAQHIGDTLASLDSEIADLEKKRDEALKIAKGAQELLDARKKQLDAVKTKRAAVGVGGAEAAAIANTEAPFSKEKGKGK